MSMSSTAIATLAANIKWKPCGSEAVFVSEMETSHLRAALGCCINKAFENNGLSHREWYDIFTAELDRREGSKRQELLDLKEGIKKQRKAIAFALEIYSDDVSRAINLARELDYQTEYLESYLVKSSKALADLR